MDQRKYNAWLFVKPAADVAGEWVAHCLEFDVVSQGSSLQHAVAMVLEATQMVVVHDLNAKKDPADRRAPQEYFDELYELLEDGTKVATGGALLPPDVDASRIASYAVQVELLFIHTDRRDVAGRRPPSEVEAGAARTVPMAVARRSVTAPPAPPPC